jgi:aryl-alcohol dehydrogenase-like predicted oxidoreductase/adenylate kinase family enzyme
MRLSTEPRRDEAMALATLRAALDAGITTFDTARSYALDEDDLGHGERLLARALREHGRPPGARVITKCGMRRDGGAWIPDGRAGRIADDAAASVEALGGAPPDVLLLHAPDPAVPIATSARALARARDAGLARAVGVANVSRKQLEEAAAHAPIAAVEVALGAYDHLAVRGGVVAYCLERGIEVLAYAPLGGPGRAPRLARDRALAEVAARHPGAGPVDVFLAYLLAVRPELWPVVGARRPETVARLRAAARLVLDDDDLVALDGRFQTLGSLRRPPRASAGARDVEVVMVAGIPGAGKSRLAEEMVAVGYERLNRDTLGGTLAGIARRLDERLRAGAARVVLDNTYVTRAARHDVVRVARAHGARVRCLFLETPLAEAQVNAVLRMLDRFGRLLEPDEMRALVRREPAALAPRALQRMTRDLELPAADEGFAHVELRGFVRAPGPAPGRPAGVIVALDAIDAGAGGAEAARALARQLERFATAAAPCLLLAWRPDAGEAQRASLRALAQDAGRAAGRDVELAVCAHPAGPPACWCRPPLPGLPLAFAHRRGVDLARSTLVGASITDRALAGALGAAFVTAV